MTTEHAIAEEDALRAHVYALLARLLSGPPSAQVLEAVRGLGGDESEFGQTLNALAAVAKRTTPEAANNEYHDLFIGIVQGELQPYGSYYLTGFLHEKPLAILRGDMARLGITRRENVPEPEDHIAALCEMMAGLITGAFGEPADVAEQRAFFETHIGSWAPRFFENLEAAKAAVLYMPVGRVGRYFMRIESEAFAMAA
jgi:TorA maturation chaperone TorD